MTTREKINSFFEGELLLLEPDMFDATIIGISESQPGREPCVVYDRMRCIEILEAMGMDREEAEEYFQFNTVGAWMGDTTPLFVDGRYAE